MRTFLNLFGRSPFTTLQSHMQNVAACVHLLPDLFEAVEVGDFQKVQLIATAMSEHEHQADITKNDIRNHLPKSLFLPIDRNQLLEILSTQDRIADVSEDIAVLVTLKPLVMFDSFRENFKLFLHKNIESFDEAQKIIQELHELLESSFGGLEAEKVKSMVDTVAYKEHEADLIQRDLIRSFFAAEKELTLVTFDLWQRIFESVASISNLSEHLANRVRMTLEVK
jgi:uncharacterized protein